MKIHHEDKIIEIDDERWKEIVEYVMKEIQSDLDLLNSYNRGEKIPFRVPTIDEEGKKDELILTISKLREKVFLPKKTKTHSETRLDKKGMKEIREGYEEVVEWEEL